MGKVKGFAQMSDKQKEHWIFYYAQRAAEAVSDKTALILAIHKVVGASKAAEITATAFSRLFPEDKL